jgi:hypothetical protein
MFTRSIPWSLPERNVAPILLGPPSEITIELRGAVTHFVTVSTSDTISSLCAVSGFRFVHNGRLLSPALSFGFLGVRDGDVVFVVAAPRQPTPVCPAKPQLSRNAANRLRERFDAHCSSRFKDPDAAFAYVRDRMDPVTAREAARLTDLFKNRVEECPASYRRVVQILGQQETGKEVKKRVAVETVVPDRADAPSWQGLPTSWA